MEFLDCIGRINLGSICEGSYHNSICYNYNKTKLNKTTLAFESTTRKCAKMLGVNTLGDFFFSLYSTFVKFPHF